MINLPGQLSWSDIDPTWDKDIKVPIRRTTHDSSTHIDSSNTTNKKRKDDARSDI